MSTAQDCTSLATARVTQTQTANVNTQLNYGVRYFDLRPALWSIENASNFYTGHFASALGGQGCLGENLNQLLDSLPGCHCLAVEDGWLCCGKSRQPLLELRRDVGHDNSVIPFVT